MATEDLNTRLTVDEDDLMTFVNQYVDSFIKWDLMRFFHENPHTIDAVDNIARYIGRDAEAVGKELAELAERGFLERVLMENLTVYTLTSDMGMQKKLARFMYASEDQELRSKIIFRLLRKGM
jgi:predicted transcriptional regulator of viral defense system